MGMIREWPTDETVDDLMIDHTCNMGFGTLVWCKDKADTEVLQAAKAVSDAVLASESGMTVKAWQRMEEKRQVAAMMSE
jgi:hypothetical protein